jgi:hypothetical protein
LIATALGFVIELANIAHRFENCYSALEKTVYIGKNRPDVRMVWVS